MMDTFGFRCDYEVRSERGEGASFRGVASTDDLDTHGSVIEPGAFLPIATRADGRPDVLLLRDHDPMQVIGGITRLTQEGRSLVCEGRLCLDVAAARETYALMREGHLRGLSVGFSPDASAVRYDGNRRHIRKAKLREISVVAMPSNGAAQVQLVRSGVLSFMEQRGFSMPELMRAAEGALFDLASQRAEAAKREARQMVELQRAVHGLAAAVRR